MRDHVLATLAAWAAQVGYTRIVDDGAVLIADEGGEIRFYGRRQDAGWALSKAERAEDETLLMVASDVTNIERYLIQHLGWGVRRRLGLSQIQLPYELDHVADGYRIDVVSDDWADLVDSATGQTVAGFRHVSVPYEAVSFSWYADVEPETLRTWLTDPRGGGRLQRFVGAQ
ncbi:Imm61 family immunity protein [Demequina sp. NBRC 110053]|uniref:Imm61 family immunity protein n=1 Tax=Demequina sp. NBRC 110053 TaxID=1570342 RepID=UPI0013566E95|nr:Imm61 family immunity protein [Demequina sp. NBRC 110053]